MSPLRLRYQTVEFGTTDIHLCTLRDRQEFHDPNGEAEELGISSASWPIFGVLWPSSLVLAHHMAGFETGTKRILEVGCGMALTSLLLNKRKVDVTATDYHPAVESFLQRNTTLNQDADIAYQRVDWADERDTLGAFDVIIGSDLLYEDEHIELLPAFINRHAKPDCEVIMVDPGRGRKNKLSRAMVGFGYDVDQVKPEHTDYLEQAFKGVILTYRRSSAVENGQLSHQ
ncbi:class I SAM-dependent methyltransferase [Reinekea blandensis]|uniref:Histidine kinase n=1 Tax=Reinekea blandensis MED297 TaxID=314283 RepID=A4BK79_9GAMM|nr:histidine kinase [Reinekea blandensis]EAR07446.1 hypothetical protein MED297_05004 [Reinekea sp. MED297] [Reinekea blandensis MED297]